MATLHDLAESLHYLVDSARQAAADGNTARYTLRHAQIDHRLTQWEAAAIAHLDPAPHLDLSRATLARLGLR